MDQENCTACNTNFTEPEFVQCSKCSGKYHHGCVLVPAGTNVDLNWSCSRCRSEAAIDSAVEGPSTSTEDRPRKQKVKKELRHIQKGLATMRTEIPDCPAEIPECEAQIHYYATKLDLLERRVQLIERKLERNPICPDEHTVSNLMNQLNNREQELLLCDLEITGVPEVRGQSGTKVLKAIAEKLEIELDDFDIIFAERVGLRYRNQSTYRRTRNIIVRLARRSIRNQLICAAKKVKLLTLSDRLEFLEPIPNSEHLQRIYVNERLTRTNKHLFFTAREAARSTEYKHVWTRDGKIFTRKAGCGPVRIQCASEIYKIFG